MSKTTYDVTDFGAVPDGQTLCTEAVQKAIDHAGATGGGTVCVPAGVFVVAPIQLRSNVTLHLDPGATLRATDKLDLFPTWKSRWEGDHAVPARAAYRRRRPGTHRPDRPRHH
ncbi:MAG: glycosyl hydrolase family 28-related protein [Tepidisphaeraceae bacterium]